MAVSEHSVYFGCAYDTTYYTYIYTRSMSYVTPHTHTHAHTGSLPHKLQKFCGKSFDTLAFVLQPKRNHFAFSPSAATISNHRQRTHTHTHTYM